MAELETVATLKKQGFAFIREAFSQPEVAMMNGRINAYAGEKHPGIMYEQDRADVRGLHGVHLYDDMFAALVRDNRLLAPALAFCQEPVYVHQFKINYKKKMVGDGWPWHQDYIFWQAGDGIASPRLLNVAIILDDVSLLSGPLCLIPGSHTYGELSDVRHRADGQAKDGDYSQDISKTLTYQVGEERIATLLRDHGHEFATGKAGDVLLFDPLLVHCSSGNISPVDRKLLIVTYNPTSNPPSADKATNRPEYLCARDYQPLVENDAFARLLESQQ